MMKFGHIFCDEIWTDFIGQVFFILFSLVGGQKLHLESLFIYFYFMCEQVDVLIVNMYL